MKRWLAEISWRWYFWICPNNPKCQEEEQSCNRDHTNWYLRSIINDSINIISTSQRFKALSTNSSNSRRNRKSAWTEANTISRTEDQGTTVSTSSQHHSGQHPSIINDSINIITTQQRSGQLVTPKHHQRQYQPASSNHYNSNPTHKNINVMMCAESSVLDSSNANFK